MGKSYINESQKLALSLDLIVKYFIRHVYNLYKSSTLKLLWYQSSLQTANSIELKDHILKVGHLTILGNYLISVDEFKNLVFYEFLFFFKKLPQRISFVNFLIIIFFE